MQGVANLAFIEQHVAGLEAFELGRRDDVGQLLSTGLGREARLNRAQDEYLVDFALDRLDRIDQAIHRASRRLDHHAAGPGQHSGRAAPAGDQAHLAEEFAAFEGDALVLLRVDHDLHFAFDDGEKGICIIVAGKDRFAGFRRTDIRIEHELAQLQRRDMGEQAHIFLHPRQGFIDAAEARHRGELRLEQWLIGRLDLVAEDVFDDFVTLVHRLLYQRIAAKRTDDIQAFHIGFVLRTDRRHRGRILVREHDAAGLDEATRCGGAQAGDHAVEQDLRLAVFRGENHAAFLAPDR